MTPVRFSYDADEGWVACRDLSNPDEPRGYGWTRPLAVAALIENAVGDSAHPAVYAALEMSRLIEEERGVIYARRRKLEGIA